MKRVKKEEKKDGLAEGLYFWLQTVTVILLLFVLATMFVGRPIRVDGASMNPTLYDRDMMLVRSIGYTPKAGDIVVLNKPFEDVTEPIVKRIIAVSGQTVEIDYYAGTVTVDGVVLEEDYILEPMIQRSWQVITRVTVPEGQVFVMGDNRNVSNDSRNPALDTVDERYVMGKVSAVLPLSRILGSNS